MDPSRPKRRWRRLSALLVLGLMVAPGHLVRTAPIISDNPGVVLVPLAHPQPDGWPSGLRLSAIWEVTGNDWRLGGWSALAPAADGRFHAFSDRGTRVMLDPAGGFGAASKVRLPRIPAEKSYIVDIESSVMDAQSGTLWLGLEYHNAVVRFDPSGAVHFRQPDAMKLWPINGGPEAMARLPDGRFIVLAENAGGLLFAGDPLEVAEPMQFTFTPPDNFLPTDAVALDDGSLLVLLRALDSGLPPFDAQIVRAFPSALEEGGELEYEPFVELIPGLPRENYEGLTITPAADGTLDLWLVSDDNQASFQRSLLVQLNWDPEASPDTDPEASPDAQGDSAKNEDAETAIDADSGQ